MNTRFFLSILLFITIFPNLLFAQAVEENQAEGLQQAFDQMKEDSYDFENNEVIKKALLNQFWQQVTDTLTAHSQRFQQRRADIVALNGKISALEATIVEKEKAVEESQYLVENLHVLGIPINKSVFAYLNLSIIVGLGGVIGYGYGKYKQSIQTAQVKTGEYEKVVEDLEQHKKKSKEKEMKLRRELQTEVNRNEELKKRISG